MTSLSLSADQRELVLPAASGIYENPRWNTFARNLVARTLADRLLMVFRLGGAIHQTRAARERNARELTEIAEIDWPEFSELFVEPHGSLRANRVYAIDELLQYGSAELLQRQEEWLTGHSIRHVRLLRIAVQEDVDMVLILASEREEIRASTVSLLSSLAPHLTAALHTLDVLAKGKLALHLAETALTHLGIGQIAFDSEGRIVAADQTADLLLNLAPEPRTAKHRRLSLSAETASQFTMMIKELVSGIGPDVRVLTLDDRDNLSLLLRRPDLKQDGLVKNPAAIGIVRKFEPEINRQTALAIKDLYGLSDREASLAHAMSLGGSIIETGQELHLTKETARNYSKRIYSKTGTKGQSDLARLILNGLAPLA